MDAKSSAGGALSKPAAAQRCAEGAGLDSGAPAEAQSAMPSIAALTIASTADHLSPTPLPSMAPQLQSRISTSLTDVTMAFVNSAFERKIIPLRDERGALFIPDRNYGHHQISRGRRGRSRSILPSRPDCLNGISKI